MIYRLLTGNHEDKAAIGDALTWLSLLLKADGQQITQGEQPVSYGTGSVRHVVIENFAANDLTTIRLAGIDWVCVCTEIPGELRFNEHDAERADYWFDRFQAFMQTAASAAELWLTSHHPGITQRYKDIFP